MDTKLLKAYEGGLSQVKQKYAGLIKRIENNRNKKNAHIQRKEELGFDPDMTRQLNEWSEATGDPRRLEPVEEEWQHLLLSTLPRTEITQLLGELKGLIHFGLWQLPKTDRS